MASGQNLGPLTSAYTLPSSCAADLQTIYKVHTVSEGWYYLIQGSPEQTSCYPSSYDGATTQYYSPGVCPQGFTPACSTATASETIYNCCPTDYEYGCLAGIDNPAQAWQSTLGCTVPLVYPSGYSQTVTFLEVSDGTSDMVTSVLPFTGGINAYSIQVRVAATDAGTVTSTSASHKTTSTTKATPSTTSKVVSSTTSKTSSTTTTTSTSQTTSSPVYTYPSGVTNSVTSASTTSSTTTAVSAGAGVSVARGLSAIALMSVALFIMA